MRWKTRRSAPATARNSAHGVGDPREVGRVAADDCTTMTSGTSYGCSATRRAASASKRSRVVLMIASVSVLVADVALPAIDRAHRGYEVHAGARAPPRRGFARPPRPCRHSGTSTGDHGASCQAALEHARAVPRCVMRVESRAVLIVQKYGGTSVGSIERMKNVAARCLATAAQGPPGRRRRVRDVGRDQPPARADAPDPGRSATTARSTSSSRPASRSRSA